MYSDTRWDAKLPVVEEIETPQQYLLEAADMIEKHGHCTYAVGNEHIGFCMIGAIPIRDRKINDLAFRRLSHHIYYVKGNIEGVVTFNATHTKAEVIANLREAANG